MGEWLGYFGDQIVNASEYIGLNNVISKASDQINNTLENYNLKNTINKAVDYTKSAGEYVIDKAKEITQSQIVNDTKEKIAQSFDGIKNTAINMVKSNNNNNNSNNNMENENNK